MKQESYIRIFEFVRRYRHGENIVRYANLFLTRIVYVAYCIMLFVLAVKHDGRIYRIVFVTGISFILVSVFRKMIDKERPYTKYNFVPLIPKEKKGQSMPSRHVFSAFIIGMALLYVYPPAGIFIFVDGIAMGVIRVVTGVHFPRDVIAGAGIGILCGIIGFL